ncbi:hypothetical protein BC830DRAFT_1088600 [Chytriomyces sp. MP71]|nr:hypothetical protein BC830DRAFT_1088600 [Chytriomyces sp. MP71]
MRLVSVWWWWTMLAAAVLAAPRLTDEEKRILRESADEADRHVRQVSHADLADYIKSGYHLITYGAVWCRLTQRFAPKWLEVQDEFDHRGWTDIPGFGIAKVQCAEDEEFCVDTMGTHDGYPDIRLYWGGELLEVYHHGFDKDSIIRFLEHIYEFVKQEHYQAAVPEVIEMVEKVESAKPSEPAPSREPIHDQLEMIQHLDDNMLDMDVVDEGTREKVLQHELEEYNVSRNLPFLELVKYRSS